MVVVPFLTLLLLPVGRKVAGAGGRLILASNTWFVVECRHVLSSVDLGHNYLKMTIHLSTLTFALFCFDLTQCPKTQRLALNNDAAVARMHIYLSRAVRCLGKGMSSIKYPGLLSSSHLKSHPPSFFCFTSPFSSSSLVRTASIASFCSFS